MPSSLPAALAIRLARSTEIDSKRLLRLNVVLWGLGLLVAFTLVAQLFGNEGDWFKAGVGLFLGACLIAPALWISRGARENHARLKTALAEPKSILWIYGEERRVNGAAMYRFVMLALADGTTVQLAMPFAEQERVMAELRAWVPEASYGFSETQLAHYQTKVDALVSAH